MGNGVNMRDYCVHCIRSTKPERFTIGEHEKRPLSKISLLSISEFLLIFTGTLILSKILSNPNILRHRFGTEKINIY